VAPSVSHGPFGNGGTVEGFSKFDSVRSAFEENFALRQELGAQLVVYQKGEKVIDLCGNAPEQPKYDANTLQCVYSSGKNMEAISVAMLVDRGLLRYDDRVAAHWPEFGAHGKENITIADVMRHEGGVPYLADPRAPDEPKRNFVVTPEDVADGEALERKICDAARSPRAGNPRVYHAITRGWVVNGFLRRVDPQRRSLGVFVREEIAEPLGISYFCGIPAREQDTIDFAAMTQGSTTYNMMTQVVPALLGFGDAQLSACLKLVMDRSNPGMKPVVTWLRPPPRPGFNDTSRGRALEISSAGMFASARAVAKVNAAMAGDGSVDGVRLLTRAGVERAMASVEVAEMEGLGSAFGMSQGGFGRFSDAFADPRAPPPIFAPDDARAFGNFVGWGGWGGSLSLWDRDRDISLAYCMNAMEPFALGGPRSRRILLALQSELEQ